MNSGVETPGQRENTVFEYKTHWKHGYQFIYWNMGIYINMDMKHWKYGTLNGFYDVYIYIYDIWEYFIEFPRLTHEIFTFITNPENMR